MSADLHSAFGEDWIAPVFFALPRGAGKAGPTMPGPMAPGSALRRRISAVNAASRKQVRARDTLWHLEAFDANAPKEELQRRRDGVITTVSGYDQDPREIYEIPEVRSYWTEVQRRCPNILFFAASEYPPALQAIFACIASRVEIMRKKGSKAIHVCIEGDSIKPMLEREMSNHVALNRSLGLDPHEAMLRLAHSMEALVGKGRVGIE